MALIFQNENIDAYNLASFPTTYSLGYVISDASFA